MTAPGFKKNQHKPTMLRLFPLLLLMLLSSCAELQPAPPDVKVTIVNIKMLESTLLEQRLTLSLRIQNRSPDPLSVYGMSFDIDINGKEFASGTSDQKTTIAAFSDEIIEVKMSSTLFGIVRQIQNMQNTNNPVLSYEISGRIYTDTLFGITFRETDEFDFRQPRGRDITHPDAPIINHSSPAL